MRSEGRFLYWYAVFIILILTLLLCIGSLCYSCVVVGGVLGSLDSINTFFKSVDSVQNVMKKQAEEQYKDFAQQSGYGFPGDNAHPDYPQFNPN